MMLVRLLVIIIVVVNSWLLKSAQSDHVQKYKQIFAQRGDREQVVVASEQCGSVSRRRLAREPAQYYPPTALPGRRARLKDIQYEATPTGPHCSGPCSPDSSVGAGELHNIWDARGKGARKVQEGLQKDRLDTVPKTQSVPTTSAQSPGMKSLSPMKSHMAQLSGKHQPHYPEMFALRGRQRLLTDSQSPQPQRHRRSSPVQPHVGHLDFFDQDVHSDHLSDYSAESEDYSGEQEGPPSSLVTEPWGRSAREIPPQWMTVLYFGGRREKLRINPEAGIELPRKKFSIELWVKPDGGQNNPAIIAGECQ